jgi:two-component system, OmpR family, phosphate regulon sensor histidine kinase PhoR
MQTVLVVDDERVIREGLRRVLSPEGYLVLTAQNGQEALNILRSEHVDVVVCDLKMPVMGAVEVLEEAGTTSPGVPVIIITGQGTIPNAVECMKKGAYDFITKPFRADFVLSVIKCALGKLPPPRKFEKLPF